MTLYVFFSSSFYWFMLYFVNYIKVFYYVMHLHLICFGVYLLFWCFVNLLCFNVFSCFNVCLWSCCLWNLDFSGWFWRGCKCFVTGTKKSVGKVCLSMFFLLDFPLQFHNMLLFLYIICLYTLFLYSCSEHLWSSHI